MGITKMSCAPSQTSRPSHAIMRMSILLLTAIVIYCSPTITTTGAATYYVDDANGNDTYSGTSWAQSWKTLNRAYTWYSGEGNKVQEGDTVYFRNGYYGTFTEDVRDTGKVPYVRTNWITYKAATGHTPDLNNIFVYNTRVNYSNGNSYLIFYGFNIRNGASIQYTNYIQIKNCTIKRQEEKIKGYWEPYFDDSSDYAVYIKDTSYVTVEKNEITHTYKGIQLSLPNEHAIIRGNTIHGISCDAFSGIATDLLIEDNYIYDLDNRRSQIVIKGTKTGTFQNGEVVVQAVTNAQGLIDTADVSSTQIKVWMTSKDGFASQANNGGKITGQSSGATLTDIVYVNPVHSDGIEVQSTSTTWHASNIIIRRNRIIRPVPGDYIFNPGGIKLGADMSGLEYLENVTVENNIVRSEIPFFAASARYVNINNNAFYGNLVRFYTITGSSNSIISSMYNNIFGVFAVDDDLDNVYVRFLSHGNNIFGNNPNGDGGPSYPFVVNGTELVNYNINSLFINAANNDFNLAPGAVAINFGNPTYAPLTDILGRSRVGAPDAGCYEFGGTIPPNADAGADQNSTSGEVSLDGSGSSDPDGNIVSYVWTKDINGIQTEIATGVNPTISLPLGQHTIKLTVTDDSGLTDTDTVTIIIELVSGLRKYFKFDEGSGTIASDSTRIGTAGRLVNGPTWTAPGEICFDGYNDAVEITTTDLNARSGTVTLWAYPSAFSKSRHFLFGHTLSQSNRIQVYCDAFGSLNVGLGDNASVSTNIQNLNTHEWYHIALVWNQTSYAMYVDGIQKANGTYSGLSSLQTYADIGNSGNRSARTEGFDGLIDEVRLYNKPLATDEIEDLALNFLPVGDKTVAEGIELRFTVRTKSGKIVEISDQNLPSMPSFASNTFSWTPGYNDAGTYEVEFTSPHDGSQDFEKITVTVLDTQQEEPVGYWQFDDSTGNTALDSSATGNTGYLLNGLTWVSGNISGALAFSVANDAVEIQTTGFNPQTGTIAMWVYPEKQTLSRHYLFGHAGNGLTNRLQLYLKYGNLCLGLGNSHETRTNIQQLQIQRWYHVALTWSSTSYNVYVDGMLSANGTYSGLSAFAAKAEIGNNGITRDKAFNGKIDEVLVYNRALNADEIAQLAN